MAGSGWTRILPTTAGGRNPSCYSALGSGWPLCIHNTEAGSYQLRRRKLLAFLPDSWERPDGRCFSRHPSRRPTRFPHFRNASMEATSFQLQSWRLPASVLWMPEATPRSERRVTAISSAVSSLDPHLLSQYETLTRKVFAGCNRNRSCTSPWNLLTPSAPTTPCRP